MARKTSVFDAHHHHHSHHEHLEYERPQKLTTPLGLFALKKLNAMNPDYLSEKDKRLLKPSAPGVITSVLHACLGFTVPVYAFSVWKNHGWVAFARPKILLPLIILMGANIGFQYTACGIRELWLSIPRSSMVNRYKGLHG